MAMTRISNVSKSAAASVLREFVDVMRQDSSLGVDGENYARGVLERALGAEKADRLLGRLKQGGYADGIEAVKW
jgi:flagellar motor switch protein FliG